MLRIFQWRSSRSEIEEQGTAILDALMRGTHVTEQGGSSLPTLQVLDKLYEMLKKSYDEQHGGFGKAPKFPQPGKEKGTLNVVCCCLFVLVFPSMIKNIYSLSETQVHVCKKEKE